jgi:serine/threonine-protein kinase
VLVADQGTQTNASVSPDGKWLAYQSDESGTLQVYVRPFPDTKVAKRQVSTGAGGAVPKWSRDGRELFYIDIQTGGVTSLPVVPGTAFTTGIPKRLFPFAPYMPAQSVLFDVSPDGKRFLFSRGVGSGVQKPDEVVLVQNFVEELKAKVKPK